MTSLRIERVSNSLQYKQVQLGAIGVAVLALRLNATPAI